MEFEFSQWLKQGAIIGKVGKWVEVFWGDLEWHSSPENLKCPVLYRNTFFLESQKPWCSYSHHQRLEWKEWKKRLTPFLKAAPVSETELEWQEPDKKEFKKLFTLIQKEIKSKTVQKAVPVVYGKAVKAVDPSEAIINSLKQAPQNTFIYGHWDRNEGEFGFTPEILFLSETPKKIKTMALAGTQNRETYTLDPEKFLSDPKELKEHQIVIDDILERLKPFGKVQASKTACLELNHLVHLYTPIQLTSSEQMSFTELIERLHPTPALGISPRSQQEFLKQWRTPHEILGAPFGVLWSPTEYLALVAIRHISWDKEFIYVGNGVGVVAESNFEEEWKELKLKRESVKRVFKI
ncbi:MAG: chorismate-binding protein [Bdellovibrionales bacterium]|nr:chorismate-binding protein [Bdellovibrionales bacterium]